jgi:DNA-binding transcriptional MocR family regulator
MTAYQKIAEELVSLIDKRVLRGGDKVPSIRRATRSTQLTSDTDISRQAVTQHLNVLAAVGLVRGIKIGREHLWEFEPSQLDEARRSLELIARQWDQALARLKAAVES